MERYILHIRIESFFASVEQNRQPGLRGKNVVVAAAKGNTSGIVLSASREACSAGITSGISIRQAQRTCPDAVILRADYATYNLIFNAFLDIAARFSPLLEPESLESAYLDVSGCSLFGSTSKLAQAIAKETYESLNLSLTTGCACNKQLARIASGMGKRFTSVEIGSESSFLTAIPICELDGVNAKVAKRLSDLGVSTIGQLANISEVSLIRQFGPVGSLLKKQSQGIDFTQVKAAYPLEIIKIEHVFLFIADEPEQILQIFPDIAEQASAQLRQKCMLAGAMTLILFDELGSGESAYESLHFKKPTDSTYTMAEALSKLLNVTMTPGMEVYRVEVICSELDRGQESQLSLLGESERKTRINRTVELINERFGDNKIYTASSLIATGKQQVFKRVAV